MSQKIGKGSLFEVKGVPSLRQVVPLGLQHVVAAIVGVITPAMIVADACGLSPADKTMLIQMSLILSALATLLQLFPIGPIGSGLPLIMGTSFAYVPVLRAIGADFGIATIFGAQIIGGVVAFLVGAFIKRIRPLFPPIVTGTVVFTIGLSLYPVAVRYMAGGVGPINPLFGSPANWLVAIITLVAVVFFNNFTKGFCKLASILLGVIVGYIVSLFFNMVDFQKVTDAHWMQWIPPLHFGLEFNISAIVTLTIMFIVNAVQAIGEISATTMGGMDRTPTDEELSGGIMANALVSIGSAFLGGLPTATYGQNAGILTANKVINRIVFAFAAGVLLLAGLIPKFAAVLTTIPQCVIGGATITVFSMIAMTGLRIITTNVKLTPRTVSVVGLSVAIGVGIASVPDCLRGLPSWMITIFGSSEVIVTTLLVILLNLILPKEKPAIAELKK